jgi:hypothetical protein
MCAQSCTNPGGPESDLLQCAGDLDKALDAVNIAMPDTAGPQCDESARKSTMDLLLEPVQALEGPRTMMLEATALVTAYITLHGAHSAALHVDTVCMRQNVITPYACHITTRIV